MGLSDDQLKFFHDNGYLIIKNFLSPEICQSLISRSKHLLEEFDLENHPKTKFSTGENNAHVGDDYFLTSGDKIRFFFEEGAFGEDGTLLVEKSKSINKIGHYLHELDPEFKEVTLSENVKEIARDLKYKDPRVLQSMVICKQPRIGGSVPCHQDSTFLYTNPVSAVGFWIALEDCTPENGCMWFVPGSHKTHPISSRFIRDPSGSGVTTIQISEPAPPPSETEWKCEPSPPGTLVLIHGSVLHKSEHNKSDKSRFIYTFHCIEGEESGAEYPKDNWLQTEAPFTKLY
ncbi:hypothetical protein HK098_003667 [Nowakowskiella sp. JEL0407]|nr:hypothetical protein HK098_003667 [Nowakowskiella sp. JEL0407]